MTESQPPGARLMGRTGEFANVSHGLELEASLGRAAENDVALNSPFLSGRHARIYFRDGDYWIEDLGSRNGTRVDGVAVAKPVCLSRVHVITLADAVDLVFVRSPAEPHAGSVAEPPPTPATMTRPSPAPSSADTVPAEHAETRFDLAFSMLIDPRMEGMQPPVGPPARVYELELTQPDGSRQIFTVKAGDNVLGRSDQCDVVLPDPEMWLSRRHATLSVQPEGVTLTDHGTVNGTFIAGARIQSAPLEPGTPFRVGPQLELVLLLR